MDTRAEAAAWWLNHEQRARRPSRGFWAVALALPWKLAAALAGSFGGSSGLRPHIETDEAALLRDTAVTASWVPPPPPAVVQTGAQEASSDVRNSNRRHEFVVPASTREIDLPGAESPPGDVK